MLRILPSECVREAVGLWFAGSENASAESWVPGVVQSRPSKPPRRWSAPASGMSRGDLGTCTGRRRMLFWVTTHGAFTLLDLVVPAPLFLGSDYFSPPSLTPAGKWVFTV